MTDTRRLFILRHAKSSWDDPGANDHERPLAPRGHRAVGLLAEHLKAHDIRPTQVLCSTSRRTRETLEGLGAGGEHMFEHDLYSGDVDEVIERLHRVPADVESVMVIGHNPAMQRLVLRLASRTADGSALASVRDKFPTGALATLTFECEWRELANGRAQLVDFTRPRALTRR